MQLRGETSAVLALLRNLGFPEPGAIGLEEAPHGVVTWRATLPGQADVLVRAAPAQGRGGLRHELAAMMLLEQHDLPRPKQWTLVPPEVAPGGAAVDWAVTTLPPGRPALELLDRPAVALRGAEDLGLALARTHELTRSARWGTAADAGRFLPIRRTWRAEVAARAAEAFAVAAAAGCDLGPELAPLDAAALDEVDGFCLVHRDLRPRNVRLHANGRLAAWTGWERAVLGDPLLDWASVLLQPAPVIAAVARGYGLDQARALREPAARARLEVYTRWLVLHELALAASSSFDGRECAEIVEHARSLVRPLSVALDALDDADHQRGAELAIAGWRPDPVASLARRALRRLALDPAPGPSEVEPLLDVLAAAWLADRFPAGAPLLAQAHALLDRLPVGAPCAVVEPVDWTTALLELAGDRTSAVLPLAWLGGWAVDRLGGRVGAGVLRGLEVLGRQAASVDVPLRSGPRRLFRTARGLGAATALGLPVEHVRAAADDAWDVVSGGLRGEVAPAAEVVEKLAAAAWAPGRTSLLAALLAAGEGALPDSVGALLAHAT